MTRATAWSRRARSRLSHCRQGTVTSLMDTEGAAGLPGRLGAGRARKKDDAIDHSAGIVLVAKPERGRSLVTLWRRCMPPVTPCSTRERLFRSAPDIRQRPKDAPLHLCSRVWFGCRAHGRHAARQKGRELVLHRTGLFSSLNRFHMPIRFSLLYVEYSTDGIGTREHSC